MPITYAAALYKVRVMLLGLFHALIGAVLGAVFGAGFGLVFVELNLNLISICAGITGVLAFVWGEPVIDWLKENLWEWFKWWD